MNELTGYIIRVLKRLWKCFYNATRIVSCSKHVRKASDLLVRIVKRNEGLQPSCARGTLEQKEKNSLYWKIISGRGWQVGTRDRVTYDNSGNREKLLSRHWPFKQHHSYCFVKVFRNSLNLAFLSVITGRLCCLITNQCCQFWSFNVRSVVLREICEVWCIADKFHLDWAQLFLFSTFPHLLRCHEVIFEIGRASCRERV